MTLYSHAHDDETQWDSCGWPFMTREAAAECAAQCLRLEPGDTFRTAVVLEWSRVDDRNEFPEVVSEVEVHRVDHEAFTKHPITAL